MKRLKVLSILISLLLVVSIFSACGNNDKSPVDEGTTNQETDQKDKTEDVKDDSKKEGNNVKISLLNSKGEIQAQLEESAKVFTEDTGIELEIIPCPAGQSPFEKASSMYASGNAPALLMIDTGDIIKFKDKLLDLSDEEWVDDAMEGALDDYKMDDGRMVGFPFAVEGFSFIYNKQVLDKAVGGEFDPSSIKTRNDLEDLFKKIEESGVAPLVISPMDWSLAGHFLPISYITQSTDPDVMEKTAQALKEGTLDLKKNPQFNGLMETFDLMKEYNIDKEDPLSGTYDRGPELLGSGEVGIWFMGNWAWPQIAEFDTAEEQYGFIPVPISDNPDDYGNSQIPVAVTKPLVLDKEQNSEEQQEAAKKFLEWLVYEDNGQDALVNNMHIIPGFKNITLEPQEPLAKSIKNYMDGGKTLRAPTILPPDHWSQVGASMQKYLSDEIDRAGLAKEIESYWKTVE
ncbi:MAG: ABC transporter substrate-binding protein [Caldicoprobacterales bacterium]